MKNKHLLVLILLVWTLSPLIWQLYTSFLTSDSILNPILSINNEWTLDNYKNVLRADPPFWKYLLNSTIVGLLTTFFTLIISLPSAYVLARFNTRLEKITKLLLVSTALFPYVLLFLALLEIAREFNIGNNLIALTIPYTALSLPLAILLLSSAFKDIPYELEEAGLIEGLNTFQRLRYILIPLIAPASASTGIIVFLFSWNEFPIALTWISDSKLITLPIAIARIAGSSVYSVPYGAYAAATVLGSLPLFIIVLIFQKQIVSGLTNGAIKG